MILLLVLELSWKFCTPRPRLPNNKKRLLQWQNAKVNSQIKLFVRLDHKDWSTVRPKSGLSPLCYKGLLNLQRMNLQRRISDVCKILQKKSRKLLWFGRFTIAWFYLSTYLGSSKGFKPLWNMNSQLEKRNGCKQAS